jgi:hypothetical protein
MIQHKKHVYLNVKTANLMNFVIMKQVNVPISVQLVIQQQKLVILKTKNAFQIHVNNAIQNTKFV